MTGEEKRKREKSVGNNEQHYPEYPDPESASDEQGKMTQNSEI